MKYILGIDEAGRGAWAGPMVVGAVILGSSNIENITDSKLLTKANRLEASKIIRSNAVFFGLGWVNSQEIDSLGLTAATTLAIKRAISGMKHEVDEIVIDGHINYLPDHPKSRCVIRADQSIPAVSAASIIAKVARDEYMAGLSIDFPAYGFESHVGYGTKKHLDSINEHGLLNIHRRSFKPIAKAT